MPNLARPLVVAVLGALTACSAGPAEVSGDQTARLALSADGTRTEAQVAELLARAPVPVLAPKDRTLERPTLSVGSEYAALTGRDQGVTIHVQGTRAAHRHANIAPNAGNRDVRGQKGFVSVNEGIRTASWVEHGVAYAVDVECSQAGDARCQDDTYVLELVNHLVLIGGAAQ